MITEPEGTDEELHALVTDAIKVGDVARRYARLYGADANTVHAAVEATLDVLLQRKAVEGSTPPDSSALDMRSRRQGGRGPVAQAGEPALVPPTVDALLKLVAQYGQHTNEEAHGVEDAGFFASGTYRQIETSVKALWAAGVEEGGRQRDEEIRADVLTSARLAAAEAGFGPAPDSVTVSYETGPTAYEQGLFDTGAVHGYELGIAEGRRQATEERAAILREAYWKLREHASALRSTEVYRKASERKEGTLRESPAFQRYRWLEATARGIEDGAHDLAEMLGVEQHEIERPEVPRG